MPNPYVYSISADMPGGACNEGNLHAEIDASAIVTTLNSVQCRGDVLTISFTGDLSAGDKTILDGDTTGPAGGLLAAHDNSVSPGGPPSARAHRTAVQSIPHNTLTAIELTAERWDNDKIHDNAINNTRFTIQTKGMYVISGNWSLEANANGIRQIAIRLNGSDFIALENTTANATGASARSASTIYEFIVGDYVELMVSQTSTITLDVVANDKFSPEFSIVRIGS